MTSPILSQEEAKQIAEETRRMVKDAASETARVTGITHESFMRMYDASRKAKSAQSAKPTTGNH